MAIFIRELLNYQRVLGGIYIVPAEKNKCLQGLQDLS